MKVKLDKKEAVKKLKNSKYVVAEDDYEKGIIEVLDLDMMINDYLTNAIVSELERTKNKMRAYYSRLVQLGEDEDKLNDV